MKKTAYSLKEANITGENFKNFIKLSMEINDIFSVSVPYYTNEDDPGVENADSGVVLDDLEYMSFETYSWYCFKVYENPLKILLFRTSVKMVNFVLKYFDSLFPDRAMRLEDICFFKENKLTFGSVTHENIAQLIDPDEETINMYRKFGQWDRVILTERDMEYIPDLKGII